MKKRSKKWLALLLGAVMAVSVTACAGQQAATKETGTNEETASRTEGVTGEQDRGDEPEGSSVTSMGRYMESSYPLPENAVVEGRALRLLDDGRLAYFDVQVGLFTSADGGESWENARSAEEIIGDHEGYAANAALAPDGSVALAYMHFEEDTMSDTLIYAGADGTRAELDGMINEGDWYSTMSFAADGTLYAAGSHGQVSRIDVENQTIQKLFMAAEGPEMMAFTDKCLLALENSGVEIYNLELGQLEDADSVLNDFCIKSFGGMLGSNSDCVGAYLVPASDGVLYLACRDGVFRHVLGGNVMEQLIEGDFSSFGDLSLGICSVILLESGEFLLLSTGEELIRFTYDPDEPTVPEKQLKVYSLKENNSIRQAISIYQKEYPDVYVSYETGMPEDSAVTMTDALKNLNLEMMGGKGPDVVVLDGINSDIYEKKGMLKDLSGILDDLTGEDSAFMNIAGSGRTQEGVYVIPAGFQLPMIVGKAEDISSVTDLASLADLTEKISQGLTEGTVTGAMTAKRELTQLFCVSSPAWEKDGKLDEAALTEFLTQTKRIYDADRRMLDKQVAEMFNSEHPGPVPIGSVTDTMQIGLGKMAYGLAKYMLLDVGGIGYFMEEEEGYDFGLLEGQTGRGFVPVEKLAIAAGTARQEEAENFVRLMLSRKVQDAALYDSFPVNIQSFDKMCEWQDQWVGGSALYNDMEFGNGWPGKETTERLKELVQQVDVGLEGNAVLEEAVLTYAPAVLEGTISVEDGVSQIKKAVSLYLSEQN